MQMNVSVQVICNECINCDEFRIEDDKEEYDMDGERKIIHCFYCESYDKCKRIANYLEKAKESNKEEIVHDVFREGI